MSSQSVWETGVWMELGQWSTITYQGPDKTSWFQADETKTKLILNNKSYSETQKQDWGRNPLRFWSGNLNQVCPKDAEKKSEHVNPRLTWEQIYRPILS